MTDETTVPEPIYHPGLPAGSRYIPKPSELRINAQRILDLIRTLDRADAGAYIMNLWPGIDKNIVRLMLDHNAEITIGGAGHNALILPGSWYEPRKSVG